MFEDSYHTKKLRCNQCRQLKMWWSALFFVILFLNYSTTSDVVQLELTTNGPVYYKSYLAIFGRLKGVEKRHYNWAFKANLPSGPFERNIVSGDKAMINETFDVSGSQRYEFEMTVKVSHTPFFLPVLVVEGKVKCVLTRNIPVTVIFEQNGTSLNPIDDLINVSSADFVKASTLLNDPASYFLNNSTQITTYWGLNNEIRLKNATFSMKYPSAAGRRRDTLQMLFLATDFNNTYIAEGSVSTIIEAKDPIVGLNVTGQLWLQKGAVTRLNFTCNGSVPIYYCFKFSSETRNNSDFNCSEEDYMRSSVCHFSLTHYFGKKGDHEIVVGVRNQVNEFLHWDPFKTSYEVHIYGAVPRKLVRLFIVPISCVIIGTIVAVSGYVLYERTKGDMRVEVADFDFTGSSTREELDATLVERTFWTHIRDELAESSPLFQCLARRSVRFRRGVGRHHSGQDEQLLESS